MLRIYDYHVDNSFFKRPDISFNALPVAPDPVHKFHIDARAGIMLCTPQNEFQEDGQQFNSLRTEFVNKFRSVGGIHGFTDDSAEDTPPPKEAESELANLVKIGRRTEAVKYFMTKVIGIPSIFVFLFRLFGKESWKKNESVAHTLAYDVAIMGGFKVPQNITASISVPTLVIGGEKSPEKLRKAVEVVAGSISKSQMVLLKGQSHNVSMKVLAPVLVDFFNRK